MRLVRTPSMTQLLQCYLNIGTRGSDHSSWAGTRVQVATRFLPSMRVALEVIDRTSAAVRPTHWSSRLATLFDSATGIWQPAENKAVYQRFLLDSR